MPISFVTRFTLLSGVSVSLLTSQTTEAIPLQYVTEIESLVLRAASVSGTADVKVEYSTSPDGTNWDSFDDNADIVASSLLDKPNNTEGFNAYPVPAPLNAYVRFKVTGLLLNPADTLVTLYAFCREGTS